MDGVLNSREGWLRDKPKTWKYVTPECADQLRELLRLLPDVKIVISSTWRTMMTITDLKKMFNKLNLPGDRIIGKTVAHLSSYQRGHEIQEYLDNHPKIERFIIIDDDADMEHLMPHLIQTDSDKGFTNGNMLEAVKKLSGK